MATSLDACQREMIFLFGVLLVYNSASCYYLLSDKKISSLGRNVCLLELEMLGVRERKKQKENISCMVERTFELFHLLEN